MAATAKYRELSTDELNALEKEFVDYLIVNGITADNWVRIKEEELEKAEDIITLFSDVVMEGVLRKIQYLEFRSSRDIKTFQCLTDKIVLVGMTTTNERIDFTNESFFASASVNPPEGVKVYTTEKSYKIKREEELFKMIQAGCEISDGKLFKTISMSLG
ncbi:MAG: hypothetical protein JXR10_01915 [Cyclobacteriaceae bacterium]